MSLDPDSIPEGLLTIPLDELTEPDIEALRQLRDAAVRGDWAAAFEILVKNTTPKKDKP